MPKGAEHPHHPQPRPRHGLIPRPLNYFLLNQPPYFLRTPHSPPTHFLPRHKSPYSSIHLPGHTSTPSRLPTNFLPNHQPACCHTLGSTPPNQHFVLVKEQRETCLCAQQLCKMATPIDIIRGKTKLDHWQYWKKERKSTQMTEIVVLAA